MDTPKRNNPERRGTQAFAAFLAKTRKLDRSSGPVRSTAHTSSVFVPADVEAEADK